MRGIHQCLQLLLGENVDELGGQVTARAQVNLEAADEGHSPPLHDKAEDEGLWLVLREVGGDLTVQIPEKTVCPYSRSATAAENTHIQFHLPSRRVRMTMTTMI